MHVACTVGEWFGYALGWIDDRLCRLEKDTHWLQFLMDVNEPLLVT